MPDKSLEHFKIDQEFPGWADTFPKVKEALPHPLLMPLCYALLVLPFIAGILLGLDPIVIFMLTIPSVLIFVFLILYTRNANKKAYGIAFDFAAPKLGYQSFDPKERMRVDSFRRMMGGDHYSRDCWLRLEKGESRIDFFQATVTSGSGNDTSTVMKGTLVDVAMADPHDLDIVLLKDAGVFNKLQKKPKGLKRVGINDQAFEKKFEVYAADEAAALTFLNSRRRDALTA